MQHSALTSLVELTLVLPDAEGKSLKGIVHKFFSIVQISYFG